MFTPPPSQNAYLFPKIMHNLDMLADFVTFRYAMEFLDCGLKVLTLQNYLGRTRGIFVVRRTLRVGTPQKGINA